MSDLSIPYIQLETKLLFVSPLQCIEPKRVAPWEFRSQAFLDSAGKDPVTGERWGDTWEKLRGMMEDAKAMTRALLVKRVVAVVAPKARRVGVRTSNRVAQRGARAAEARETDGERGRATR